MQITAVLCLDVQAESEKEARQKGKAIVENFVDGLAVSAPDGEGELNDHSETVNKLIVRHGVRAYPSGKPKIEVLTILDPKEGIDNSYELKDTKGSN